MSEIRKTFSSWREVLDAAKAGAPLAYKAPMDTRPAPLDPAGKGGKRPFTYEAKAKTIRVYPPGSLGRGRASDPFTADARHLERFSLREGYEAMSHDQRIRHDVARGNAEGLNKGIARAFGDFDPEVHGPEALEERSRAWQESGEGLPPLPPGTERG